MKKEENIAYDKLRQYELDPTQGISIHKRRGKYVRNDNAIKQLVNDYDAMQNPEDDDTLKHLRALQYRLAQNNFDEWNDEIFVDEQ